MAAGICGPGLKAQRLPCLGWAEVNPHQAAEDMGSWGDMLGGARTKVTTGRAPRAEKAGLGWRKLGHLNIKPSYHTNPAPEVTDWSQTM